MGRVTSSQLALLRSLQQRAKPRAVVYGTFAMHVYTTIEDAGGKLDSEGNVVEDAASTDKQQSVQRFGADDWGPVLNVGPHRWCLAGQSLTFDALDSYFGRSLNTNEQNGPYRGAGYGVSGIVDGMPAVTGGTWTFTGAANPSRSGPGPHAVTWTTPGLYEIAYENGLSLAKRWVRVLPASGVHDWNVTAVGGVQGTWGGGWTMSLTLQTTHFDSPFDPSELNDFRCVALYNDDEWYTSSGWVNTDVGACRHDPSLVMVGYVKQGATSIDWTTRSVTLTLESVDSQMGRGTAHAINVVNQQKHKKRRKKKRNADNEDEETTEEQADDKDITWGTILEAFETVNTSDAALYLLQEKTNLLVWHDFYATWNGRMGDLEAISSSEGSVQAALSGWANNDWNVVGCAFHGAILFAPDRQVSYMDGPWNAKWDGGTNGAMTLTAADVWKLDLSENTQKVCRWVQLIATDTFKVEDSKDARKVGRFPGNQPPPETFGTWFTRNDLLHDSNTVLEDWAETVYHFQNLKWSGTATMGLNRAIQPGDTVWLDVTGTDWSARESGAQIDWTTKKFVVMGVAYSIDAASGAWQTQLQLTEAVVQ